MSFVLPDLPYPKDAFGKILSVETFDYHYSKHHQNYVNTLNTLIKGTQWENKSLNEIILLCTDQKIYNNAAQHWNHSFYWKCMSPTATEPSETLRTAIISKWGSVSNFLDQFTASATGNFGSGWTWLVKQGTNIKIVNTSNARNPMNDNLVPLLTVDIWQHAYYIDYRNVRAQYLTNYQQIINWDYVSANFKSGNSDAHL